MKRGNSRMRLVIVLPVWERTKFSSIRFLDIC